MTVRDRAFYQRIGAMASKHVNRYCILCNRPYVTSGTSQKFCSFLCRVLSNIDVRGEDECWPWLGPTHRGYGVAANKRINRFICQLFHGPLRKDQHACHSCDKPPCCNPAHLWPGTGAENQQDAAAKGRMVHGERNHKSKLSEGQVRIIKQMAFEIFTPADVARVLDCNWSTVSRIVNGERWQHLDVQEG